MCFHEHDVIKVRVAKFSSTIALFVTMKKNCTMQANSINDPLKSLYMIGIINCSDPDAVMLCILPQPADDADVTINIEQTLLKAYCWENGIRVLKVTT